MAEDKKNGCGGARARAGRKPRNNVVIYARVNQRTADAIRRQAAAEQATVIDWVGVEWADADATSINVSI